MRLLICAVGLLVQSADAFKPGPKQMLSSNRRAAIGQFAGAVGIMAGGLPLPAFADATKDAALFAEEDSNQEQLASAASHTPSIKVESKGAANSKLAILMPTRGPKVNGDYVEYAREVKRQTQVREPHRRHAPIRIAFVQLHVVPRRAHFQSYCCREVWKQWSDNGLLGACRHWRGPLVLFPSEGGIDGDPFCSHGKGRDLGGRAVCSLKSLAVALSVARVRI